MFRWSCGLLLVAGLTGFAAEKHPVPGDTDLQAVRIRIRTLFKAEYAKTSPTGILTLVDKLMSGAAEEKGNPTTRYVMLTEAVTLAMRGGDVDKAVRAAREIDRDFEATRLDDWLADGLPNLKKDEQYGKLIRRDGVVLVPFINGAIIERLSLDNDKLVIDRYSTGSTYPKGPPQNKGEGIREK